MVRSTPGNDVAALRRESRTQSADKIGGPSPESAPRGRSILYIVPRFPITSQTFVVNEWAKLDGRFQMRIASLFRGRSGPVHPVAARVLPFVQFAPTLARDTASANWTAFRRFPRRYLDTLAIVVRKSFRRPAGGSLKGILVFWKGVRLAELVKEHDVAHVHAQLLHHPATAAWVVWRLTGTSFSVTAHADDLFLGPGLFQEKMSDATAVVTISEFNAAYIRERADEVRRLEVVHCGVDVSEFGFRRPSGGRKLISVARLEPKKGHRTLLEAFSRVASSHPELSLQIIGDGQERQALEGLARSLGVARRVEFPGALTSDKVRDALALADVFVLPARATPRPTLRAGHLDGIPVSLMEAMASGVPVVATRVSGIPELVVDGVTGLLVPPEDPSALASAIQRLIDSEELRTRLAVNARDWVEQEFNADVQAGRLADLFTEAMKSALPGVVP